MSLLLIAGYFAAGFFSDLLAANYILALSRRQRGRAPLLAFVIDIFGYAISATLILGKNIPGAISFAFGTSLGTWVAMGKENNEEEHTRTRRKSKNFKGNIQQKMGPSKSGSHARTQQEKLRQTQKGNTGRADRQKGDV
jgi:hypothetical protein